MASPQIRAIRDLLRHLEHPNRLRVNPLVAWVFNEEYDTHWCVTRIRGLISEGLESLSARQRAIVVRCDLRGESHQSVTAALAVSERHFYRERHAALERLATAFERAGRAVTQGVRECASEMADVELCFADTAYQAGDAVRALDVLRAAAERRSDKKDRIAVECRLAELSCEVGALSAARVHVARTREICAELDDSEERSAVATRIDAMEALVLWRSTPLPVAIELAASSRSSLWSTFGRRMALEDAQALALATIVLGEHDAMHGKAQSGRQKALEALQTLSLFDSARPILKARLRTVASTALMFEATHLRDAEFELLAQQREAIVSGLALEATLIGWRLSNFQRFAQAHERAVEMLRGLLPVARRLLPHEERAGMCLDLASALLVCRRPADARPLIAEANVHAVPGGYCRALLPLIEAETCLLERHFDRTLALCDVGMTAMQRLNRTQSIVNGLRLKAEAHFALGDLASAKSCIGAALDNIDGSAHPIVVGKTHRTAARITGRVHHRRLADEISNALRSVMR